MFPLEPSMEEGHVFTDEESVLDEEERAMLSEAGHVDVNGNTSQAPKKTVAQIMRDKKKQTALTLQWYVIFVSRQNHEELGQK